MIRKVRPVPPTIEELCESLGIKAEGVERVMHLLRILDSAERPQAESATRVLWTHIEEHAVERSLLYVVAQETRRLWEADAPRLRSSHAMFAEILARLEGEACVPFLVDRMAWDVPRVNLVICVQLLKIADAGAMRDVSAQAMLQAIRNVQRWKQLSDFERTLPAHRFVDLAWLLQRSEAMDWMLEQVSKNRANLASRSLEILLESACAERLNAAQRKRLLAVLVRLLKGSLALANQMNQSFLWNKIASQYAWLQGVDALPFLVERNANGKPEVRAACRAALDGLCCAEG